jgi:hypothetical protein
VLPEYGPGGQYGPTATSNGYQERDNPPPLSVVVDTRSRCQPQAAAAQDCLRSQGRG